MRWAACAASALRCLVRIFPQPSDQFLQVLRRHGFLCNDQLRLRLQVSDTGSKSFEHVVREREDRTVDDVRGPSRRRQSV